jgi:hypothetical protein
MKKQSIAMPVAFDAQSQFYAEFLASIRKLGMDSQPCAAGMSKTNDLKDGFVLSFSQKTFALVEGALVIRGLCPTPILSVNFPADYSTTNLVVRYQNAHLSAVVHGRRVIAKQTAVNSVKRSPRLHADAAIFITKNVRPQSVSGGLPSLGKK